MKGSSSDLRSFGKLFDACGDGHRPTKDEGHDAGVYVELQNRRVEERIRSSLMEKIREEEAA